MAFTSIIQSSPQLSLRKNLLPLSPRTIRCSSSSFTSLPISTKFDLKTYWKTLISEIDEKLDQAIQIQYPQQIYEAMRYSVLATGAKRAPPVMCVAACELFGGNRLAAFPTACALEMVHAASLIHDDLPCMDDDPSRHGEPSTHTIFGIDMAILAGHALFPLGFSHIVSQTPPDLVPGPHLLRRHRDRPSRGVYWHGGGPVPRPRRWAHLRRIGPRKEVRPDGRMLCCVGGLLAGAADEEIHRLRRYGRAVGVLYQVVDDLFEEKMKGKLDGDGKRWKGKSYMGVYGVEKAMEVAEELGVMAKRELDGFEKYGEKVEPLYSFVDYAADRGFSVGDHDDQD